MVVISGYTSIEGGYHVIEEKAARRQVAKRYRWARFWTAENDCQNKAQWRDNEWNEKENDIKARRVSNN